MGKLTANVDTLRKENEPLKGTTNEPRNDAEPSNCEHIGSRNARGEGNAKEERRNI